MTKLAKPRSPVVEHYVNNRDFTEAVSNWVYDRRKSLDAGKEAPPVPSYVAECFMKIARRYSRRPNWSGYTYLDDMVSEAVYLCIKYAHNFNPDKSRNAFSYFTQYAHNGFLQYINREKKFSNFKFQLVKEANSALARMDFNDINLYDEDQDNVGFADIDKVEKEILADTSTPVGFIVKNEAPPEVKAKKPDGIKRGPFGRPIKNTK